MGRIIGYARVSTEDQNPDAQVARLREAGAELVFVDHGWSGKLASRPEWDKCLAVLSEGDTLLSTKLDRFGRSVAHLVQVIPSLEARGVSVRCLDQPIDTSSAAGKMLFTILAAFAEFERNLIIERTTAGIAFKAQSGRVGRRRSFGFADDGVTVLPEEASIVVEMGRRLLAGESQDSLIKELQARGVPTIRGSEWGYTTFRQVMTRPRNIGAIVHRGKVVPGVSLPGEPIMTEDMYRRIVGLYESRRPGRPPSGKYLLTGIAQCACGGSLRGRPVDRSSRQYWCPACSSVFVRCVPLDTHVLDWAVRELSDPRHADVIQARLAEAAENRARLAREIADIESVLTELYGRLGRREIPPLRFHAAADPLEAQQAKLVAELSAAATEEPDGEGIADGSWRSPGPRHERYITWLEVATGDDVAAQRAMVVRALAGRKITVGPGRAAKFDPERVTIS